MIKEFFEEHDHLCFKLQHIDRYGGGWQIRVYNTTLDFDCTVPIYENVVLDSEINNSNISFEAMIMLPVINWWENSKPITYNYWCKYYKDQRGKEEKK